MKNKITIAVLLTAALCVAGYSALWFWAAGKIKDEVVAAVESAQEEDNIRITTRELGLGGFPGRHNITFSGLIEIDGIVIDMARLNVKSLFFIPGREAVISMPEGAAIKEPADPLIWSLDSMKLRGPIPETLPPDITREDLTVWRDAGNRIRIEHFELNKDTLKLSGAGFITLDETLQPAGEAHVRITGHFEFLKWLQQNGIIRTKDSLLATTVMTGLSRTDEDGRAYMDAGITLQNRTLFLGPLQVGHLPKVRWRWRSQPVLPR